MNYIKLKKMYYSGQLRCSIIISAIAVAISLIAIIAPIFYEVFWSDSPTKEDMNNIKSAIENHQSIKVDAVELDTLNVRVIEQPDTPLPINLKVDVTPNQQLMFGLPTHTEVGTQLPKKSIYAKFAMNTAEKEKFDADISRIVIANAVDGRHVAEGEKVKLFYVLAMQLKRKEYDSKNIVSLVKLINQNILFALTYENEVQLAVYCTRLVTSDWQSIDNVAVLLRGLNLDAVWENIVASIGDITIVEGKSVAEQIVEDDAHAILMKQIEQLEQKARAEKQPRKKLELFEKLKELKKRL